VIKIKLKYEYSHKEIDGNLYKLCNKCYEWFECTTEYFYATNNKSGGLFPYCKSCAKKKSTEWVYDNYEKVLQFLTKNNRKPNIKEKKRLYSKLKRESGKQLEWQRNNPDKIKGYQLKRKINKTHNFSNGEWNKCLVYFDYSCAYCGVSQEDAIKLYSQILHREHVDHNGSNDLSNNVPACKLCNSLKWAYDFNDWYNEENKVYSEDRKQKVLNWINGDYIK
jgi:hypothetical protein